MKTNLNQITKDFFFIFIKNKSWKEKWIFFVSNDEWSFLRSKNRRQIAIGKNEIESLIKFFGLREKNDFPFFSADARKLFSSSINSSPGIHWLLIFVSFDRLMSLLVWTIVSLLDQSEGKSRFSFFDTNRIQNFENQFFFLSKIVFLNLTTNWKSFDQIRRAFLRSMINPIS